MHGRQVHGLYGRQINGALQGCDELVRVRWDMPFQRVQAVSGTTMGSDQSRCQGALGPGFERGMASRGGALPVVCTGGRPHGVARAILKLPGPAGA